MRSPGPLPRLLPARWLGEPGWRRDLISYPSEGVTGAWSEAGVSRNLALAEIALSLGYFAAAVGFARLTRPEAR
jgi:hypothetical protein